MFDTEEIMRVWVIYDHPRDYPDGFIVRGQVICVGGDIRPDAAAWFARSLDQARELLHAHVPHLVRLERDPNDEPHIVECWI